MDTDSITREQLDRWAKALSAEHATPIVLVAVGHEHTAGKRIFCTVDEDDVSLLALAAFLRQAADDIEQRIEPQKPPPNDGQFHPLPTDTLFSDSPDAGQPACKCSRCGQVIHSRIPIRMFTTTKPMKEYRYHPACLGLQVTEDDDNIAQGEWG